MHELIGGLTNWVYTTSDVMSVVAVPWPGFCWKICGRLKDGNGSIPITINFSGMNSYLPAILRFTRYQGFDP